MIHSTQLHSLPSSKEAEYLAGWQRARAEFDNYRKRVQSEQETLRQASRRDAIESFLELADNFQALTRHVPETLAEDAWVQGVTHVARQFEQVLEDNGVTAIVDSETEFDPAIHDAIETVKSKGKKSGSVVEVVRVGYKMGDTVIRPAKVKVAA